MVFLKAEAEETNKDRKHEFINKANQPLYQRTTVDFLHRQDRIQPGDTKQLTRISRFEADSILSFAVQTDQTNATILIMLGAETYPVDLSEYTTRPIASTKAWFGVVNWDTSNTNYVIAHEEPIPFNQQVHELRIAVAVPDSGSATNANVYMKVKKYA